MEMKTRFKHGRLLLGLTAVAAATVVIGSGQKPVLTHHPAPQPRLAPSTQSTDIDAGLTTVVTDTTFLAQPEIDPFSKPPGTNFLPTIYTNMFDGLGNEMPHTLPSTPTIPYNLHDGDPQISKINRLSPTDDLDAIFDLLREKTKDEDAKDVKDLIELAIDILEGEDLDLKVFRRNRDLLKEGPFDTTNWGDERAYQGFPLLHYKGPRKTRRVEAIRDEDGNVIGGNVDVRQIWYDQHIESDTAFIDASAVLDVPWTVTYKVDVLTRGEDDFAPFVMYFDDPSLKTPQGGRLPHIGMDQTFFPMADSTRMDLKIRMTPGKYLNLVYTWGWRYHPPRIQVFENALKYFPSTPGAKLKDIAGNPVERRTLPEWEEHVFGNGKSKQEAIEMIGNLSPAKRMWNAFREFRGQARAGDDAAIRSGLDAAYDAFLDWRDRTKLPSNLCKPNTATADVCLDPDSDITLLYVNNTIYGEFSDGGPHKFPEVRWPDWKLRGSVLKATMFNGDYYRHAYLNVDFGGARGWENQFKSSTKVGGSGCWFTFGRAHWMFNMAPIVMTPAERGEALSGQDDKPSKHHVQITYNYEPSRRLRFYQFDPMHHDVAIFSVH